MNQLRQAVCVVLMVEKPTVPGEYLDPAVQKYANANPTMYAGLIGSPRPHWNIPA